MRTLEEGLYKSTYRGYSLKDGIWLDGKLNQESLNSYKWFLDRFDAGTLDYVGPLGPETINAPDIMQEGMDAIKDRASERDTEGERSMKATVNSFNAMYDTNLTEEQGWQFMVLLKMARAKGPNMQRDSYVDGSAYFALAGEAASKTREHSSRVAK